MKINFMLNKKEEKRMIKKKINIYIYLIYPIINN